MRIVLKSKIHRVRVTDTDLDYEGSIGIDSRLMREADLLPYEQVHVLNVSNGARFETYVIEEPEGSGRVTVFGAAARLTARGDTLIILSYQVATEEEAQKASPRVILVDANNAPVTSAP